MLVKKDLFKDILHFLSYIIVIGIILIICLSIYNSYSGYQLKTIVDNCYYNNNSFINVVNNSQIQFITEEEKKNYFYYIVDGILTFNDEDYVIFKNGLLNLSNNVFYFKV